MKQRIIATVLVTCFALPSCGNSGLEAPYKMTLYSGGVAVREWGGVSDYTRWDDSDVEIHADGESFLICGGPIVIEHDESSR